MVTNGIHHVTAIAGVAARNVAFYTQVLGLRLVKRTVNFDDPSTYHLYYGDETGRPGTILTFFPWEQAAYGRIGTGETSETAFRVPKTSLVWWTHHFLESGVVHEAPVTLFGETVLPFRDPDGMSLALVGVEDTGQDSVWSTQGIPAEHAIRGLHGVTLMVARAEDTAAILTDVFGFTAAGREGSLWRFSSGAIVGGCVTLRVVEGILRGLPGAGTVHHIAFRAPDDIAQLAMVERLKTNHRIATTEQKDRNYFRSVYFREPGGVLFEIATDTPGFTVDESIDTLGQALKLPAQYEANRLQIESVLPDLGDTA